MLREEKWIGISNHLFKPSSKIVLVECGRCLFYRRFGVRSMGVENMNLKRKNYASEDYSGCLCIPAHLFCP